VYELKNSLHAELVNREEVLRMSQKEVTSIQALTHSQLNLLGKQEKEENERKEEDSPLVKSLLDEVDRKETIISGLDQMLLKLTQDLEDTTKKNMKLEELTTNLQSKIQIIDEQYQQKLSQMAAESKKHVNFISYHFNIYMNIKMWFLI
jgi:hypothetical protein